MTEQTRIESVRRCNVYALQSTRAGNHTEHPEQLQVLKYLLMAFLYIPFFLLLLSFKMAKSKEENRIFNNFKILLKGVCWLCKAFLMSEYKTIINNKRALKRL